MELRHSIRQLGMSPGFAAVSVLSLALGIGASATVFSVLYGVLIAPYPYRGAGRMVRVRLYGQSGARNYLLLSLRQFAEFRMLDAVDGAVAMDNWEMASTGDALPEAVRTAHLSADAFAYFGVPPIAGRTFAGDEARVAVLSYPYWQRRYGGERRAIGAVLQLDHQDYSIIGVMPPRFRWGTADVYSPLVPSDDPDRIYIIDARLKGGVTHQLAEAQMQPLLEQFASETPAHFPRRFRVHVSSLTGLAGGGVGNTLVLLLAATGVLLAVGCANVSILLLARGTARLHEFAVRAALGASRMRLLAQMFTEAAMLAMAGGTGGVLLAIAGVQAAAVWLPAGALPAEAVIHVNVPVLAFSTAVACLTGLLAGISPALHFSDPQLHCVMRASSSQRVTEGARKLQMRDLLVAGQVALTILMLAAAGGATRAFLQLYHTRLGYDPQNVLMAGITLPDGNYTAYEPRAAFYRAIHRRVAELPGIRSVAIASFPIPPAEAVRHGVEIAGRPPEQAQTVDVQQTTGEYFAALRIPMLKGRTWSEAETTRAAHVAVINQEMARRFWPNGEAVGQRIRLPEFKAITVWTLAAPDSNGWLEVIGVGGDTPNRGLREPIAPMVYVPYTLMMGDSIWLVARTAGAPLGMLHAIREQIHAVDAGQPVSQTRTAEELLRAEGWAREQLVASLLLLLAVLTLALAATGLYSVMAYATALRSREFGIRLALGARRGHVLGMVLGSAATTVSAGAAVGLAVTLACRGLIARWVPGFGFDPSMLGGIALVLYASASLAAWAPARRAAACDPAIVLRGE